VFAGNVEAKFPNNAGPRNRALALFGVFGVMDVTVGIVHAESSGIPAIVAGLAICLIAYRIWVGGLFLTPNSMIIRNVFSTRHFSLGEVIRAQFVRDPRSARWGYIKIETTGGGETKITTLRRRSTDGSDLAKSINTELRSRRSAT
jgi:hypothetical protein